MLDAMLLIVLKVEPDFGMDVFEDSGKKQGKQPKQSPSVDGKKPKQEKQPKTNKAPVNTKAPKKKVRDKFACLFVCLLACFCLP